MLSIEDRIKYYIGKTKDPYVKPTLKTTGYDVPIAINLPTYRHNFHTIHPNTAYPIDVVRMGKHSSKPTLWFQCGDSPYTDYTWPVLVKIRDTKNKSSKGIIANLDSTRHLGDIFKITDIPWADKRDDWLWRGADTGRGIRLDFVRQFYQQHDVGFSGYVQDALICPELYPKHLLKPKVPPEHLLQCKYLPIIDGNDKSSSLGWILASNSLPLMPRPRYHSWLCEPWLEPGVHYVEVKRDFSDLVDKIQWCKDHDHECNVIADNGKKFMMQFTNPTQEEYIEKQIVTYINEQDLS